MQTPGEGRAETQEQQACLMRLSVRRRTAAPQEGWAHD
jgi:hypothetical protein